ncbi:MAG: molecular chaperone HtpG [Planctomycetaceae bacterium]|nr:molecular chaperone HtpG [Planctomycetaceae bacterium]
MATGTDKQQFSFQAEIKQLLHLLAHSLYQTREIAIRELISNASDALDKMRYIALTDEAYRDTGPLEIVVEGDKDARRLIIRDNGIGMTHDELVTNLGTIAHSGSLEFLRAMAARQAQGKADVSLIGQFGVGFYSAFMVADAVRVRTRSYQESAGWEWESDGSGTFTVGPAEGLGRGTEVILHLKEDAKEFAEDWRIKGVIKRYSSFVPHPVKVDGAVVNDQKPIWVEPKSQVTDEQYRQFYQHLTHRADEAPLWHLHLAADSPIQFHALLYCPRSNPELLGFGRQNHGLQLCAKRVLVQSDCQELVPEYLRFLYGLVDSEDLPLNVSRETLQDNTLIRRIRNTLVKGVLDRLQKLADESPDDFLTFARQFNPILREGIAVDPPNRDRIARLLRFTSSHTESTGGPPTSLPDYVSRMQADQKRIYYVGGPDLGTIQKSPNLEVFRRRKLEVLYLTDPIDEFVMSSLGSFDGKTLTSIDAAELDLPGAEPESEATPEETAGGGLARLLELFRRALGDRVKEVRESKRLTDSPCCLVNVDAYLSTQMQRLLRMANKDLPASERILEVNPAAPIIRRLSSLTANPDHEGFIKQCALQLWANAQMLEGVLVEPQETVNRIQSILEEAAEKRSPIVF